MDQGEYTMKTRFWQGLAWEGQGRSMKNKKTIL